MRWCRTLNAPLPLIRTDVFLPPAADSIGCLKPQVSFSLGIALRQRELLYPRLCSLSGCSSHTVTFVWMYKDPGFFSWLEITLKGHPVPELPVGLSQVFVVTASLLNFCLVLLPSLLSGVAPERILIEPPAGKSPSQSLFLREPTLREAVMSSSTNCSLPRIILQFHGMLRVRIVPLSCPSATTHWFPYFL